MWGEKMCPGTANASGRNRHCLGLLSHRISPPAAPGASRARYYGTRAPGGWSQCRGSLENPMGFPTPHLQTPPPPRITKQGMPGHRSASMEWGTHGVPLLYSIRHVPLDPLEGNCHGMYLQAWMGNTWGALGSPHTRGRHLGLFHKTGPLKPWGHPPWTPGKHRQPWTAHILTPQANSHKKLAQTVIKNNHNAILCHLSCKKGQGHLFPEVLGPHKHLYGGYKGDVCWHPQLQVLKEQNYSQDTGCKW